MCANIILLLLKWGLKKPKLLIEEIKKALPQMEFKIHVILNICTYKTGILKLINVI